MAKVCINLLEKHLEKTNENLLSRYTHDCKCLAKRDNGNGNGRSLASPSSLPRFRRTRGKTSVGINMSSEKQGVSLLAPLIYIPEMLLFMASFGFTVFDLGHDIQIVSRRGLPGLVYRSQKRYASFGYEKKVLEVAVEKGLQCSQNITFMGQAYEAVKGVYELQAVEI